MTQTIYFFFLGSVLVSAAFNSLVITIMLTVPFFGVSSCSSDLESFFFGAGGGVR